MATYFLPRVLCFTFVLGLVSSVSAADQPKFHVPKKLTRVPSEVPCRESPIELPHAIRGWAYIYCSEFDGEVFTVNSHYIGFSIKTGAFLSLRSNELGGLGTTYRVGRNFSLIETSVTDIEKLRSEGGHVVRFPSYVRDSDQVIKIILKVNTGAQKTLIVVNPLIEPFILLPYPPLPPDFGEYYIASKRYLSENVQP